MDTITTPRGALLATAAFTLAACGEPVPQTVARTVPAPAVTTADACAPKGLRVPDHFVTENGANLAVYTDPCDLGPADSATFGGGAVQVTTDLQLVFWGSSWPGSPKTPQLTQKVKDLLAGPYFAGLTTPYGFNKFNFRGVTFATDNPPTDFDCHGTVGDRIWDMIDAGMFPEPDEPGGRIFYVVFMPPGVSPHEAADGAHCATSNILSLDNDHAWIAWIGDSDSLDTMTVTLSHEMVEAATDPEDDGWRTRDINGGEEIGDACWHTEDVLNDITVQAYFSNTQHACVIPFPMPLGITSILPSAGPPGGFTDVRIFGHDFDTTGATRVTFGGTPAVNVTCPSTTECIATSPPGNGQVDIEVSLDRTSAHTTFLYSPTVTQVTPASGNVGDTVTIHGFGFSSVLGATRITFGGVPATNVNCYPGPDCTATVPAGSGTVDVQVTVFGTLSNTWANDQFTYFGPRIDSISPAFGPLGGGNLVGIVGSGFDSSMTVMVGNQPANVICMNHTWCNVDMPAVATPQTAHIQAILGSQASALTSADVYTYEYLPHARALAIATPDLFAGQTGSATLSLDEPAGPGGLAVSIAASPAAAIGIPSSVTVPAGQSAVTFALAANAVSTPTLVTVTATVDSSTVTATLLVFPAGRIAMLVDNDSLAEGDATTAQVIVSQSAPSGGTLVTLQSTDPTALVTPASVVIPAGQDTVNVTVRAGTVSRPEQVTLTATGNGGSITHIFAVFRPFGGGGGCSGPTCQ